ncbi:MAG: exonuclease domain-containing protein [Eubacteriales bacterium]|nr:exonuclease domain-containing protein [Eubacteriales bacterium]
MGNKIKTIKKYYFVIAAKKKRAERVCMVVSHIELISLIEKRYPIYRQQGFRSKEAARRVLEQFISINKANDYKLTEYEDFIMDNFDKAENRVSLYNDEDIINCFYDSEFGMYNYGEQQGDVVSIGAVILRDNGNSIFSRLIRNTDKEQLAERFTSFTGLRQEELALAPAFPEVFREFVKYIEENKVDNIFCLGGNDRERLEHMLIKYKMYGRRERAVLDKFVNFQKWLRKYDERLALFSLESLAYLCEINNEKQHNALSDAITLALVWQKLSVTKISDKAIRAEQEAAKLRNKYKKSRKISYERIPVSADIIALKNKLVNELKQKNLEYKSVPTSVMKALCDDLDELLIEENTGTYEMLPYVKKRKKARRE